ncbi:Uncharacterized protein ToN1_50220 [Aromatoleum petrolei]|nr:Uncharacterized protein ToN1_50220 [Aromatoleum petrolei]
MVLPAAAALLARVIGGRAVDGCVARILLFVMRRFFLG